MKSEKEAFPLPKPTPLSKPFWAAAKQGRLTFQQCEDCESLNPYPKPWCSECGSRELSWKQVSGKGSVYSFTVPREVVDNSPAFEDKLPFVVAIVELEEGPRIYSNIVGLAPEKVSIGMKVEVTFEEVGTDLALPKFRPAMSPVNSAFPRIVS